MNIPLRERNDLLLASGFAPKYNEQSIDAEQMTIITRAIDRMLKQHEPHPALVLDHHWVHSPDQQRRSAVFWLIHRP